VESECEGEFACKGGPNKKLSTSPSLLRYIKTDLGLFSSLKKQDETLFRLIYCERKTVSAEKTS